MMNYTERSYGSVPPDGGTEVRRVRTKTSHRKKVRHYTDQTRQASCACGWQGDIHRHQADVDADWRLHVVSLLPPEQQRCRVREHRTAWWEPCPLCADQLVLPGLEKVAQ